jgi:nucleoside-diphosphate-sugar epimerase
MRHRIFLAGATGVIGRRLIPMLTEQGHEVFGTTRLQDRVAALERAGARSVVVDVLDGAALRDAVQLAAPDIVIHQLTDLSAGLEADPDAARKANARLRREGTANLVSAALGAGARRIIAQSIAWAYAPGTLPYGEAHPLDTAAQGARATTVVDGIVPLERAVLGAPGMEGIVLRYGQLYGPDTWTPVPDGASPLHVDAAAYAAFRAVDGGEPGIYNIAEAGGEVDVGKAMAVLGWSPAFRLEGAAA